MTLIIQRIKPQGLVKNSFPKATRQNSQTNPFFSSRDRLENLLPKTSLAPQNSFSEHFTLTAQTVADQVFNDWRITAEEISKYSGAARANLHEAYLLALDHAEHINKTTVQPRLKEVLSKFQPEQTVSPSVAKRHENALLKLANPMSVIRNYCSALLEVSSYSVNSMLNKGSERLRTMFANFPSHPLLKKRSLVSA